MFFHKLNFVIFSAGISMFLQAENKKIYVELENISLSENGIYWIGHRDESKIEITSLHKDEYGFYFTPTAALNWTCPDGHANQGSLICRICGKSPDGIKRY